MPLIATRLLLASLVLVGATACTPQSDPETGRSLAPSAGLPAANAAAGQAVAQRKGQATGQSCVDCHGAEGKGVPAMGAPNLTASTGWIYGSSLTQLQHGTFSLTIDGDLFKAALTFPRIP